MRSVGEPFFHLMDVLKMGILCFASDENISGDIQNNRLYEGQYKAGVNCLLIQLLYIFLCTGLS